MTDAFIGIDVAVAKQVLARLCFCTVRDGRVVPEALRKLPIKPPRGEGNAAILDENRASHFAKDAASYVSEMCARLALTPKRIAVDVPSAPCADGLARRAAES